MDQLSRSDPPAPGSDRAPAGTPIAGAAALVTGGHRGFRRPVVDELLNHGAARVYATSRSELHSTLASSRWCSTSPTTTRSRRGAHDVSIVVNNAGIVLGTLVLDAPLADLRAELETNVLGTLRVARAFAPILARHRPSAMVNVLSVLSWLAFGSGYELSKAAVWSATNSMRLRLRDQGTTVTAVHVAYMDTEMAAGVTAPKADPRDVAQQLANAVLAGSYEVLADPTTRAVRAQLSQPLNGRYPQLAG